jgi:hypothetical protein
LTNTLAYFGSRKCLQLRAAEADPVKVKRVVAGVIAARWRKQMTQVKNKGSNSGRRTAGATTFGVTTFRIMAPSIRGLIVTFNIRRLGIRTEEHQLFY